MKIIAIKNLLLQNFRIHQNFFCEISSENIVLLGNNGSGKTSILEAITLLSPGKGMLSANAKELNFNNENNSSITVNLNNETKILIENSLSKKNISINDKNINKQSDLINWCDVIWFVADMQYNFLLSSSNRRKFFDRMVFSFFINHASLLNNYEKLLKEKLKIFQLEGNNEKWLNAIDKQISFIGSQIISNRNNFILDHNKESINNLLPSTQVIADGFIDMTEETLFNELQKNRKQDIKSGRNNIGPHRTDFFIINEDKKHIINNSSGLQKMSLLSVFETFAKLISIKKERTPIILLDEIGSFVDKNNFEKIISSFNKNYAQVWMTTPSYHDMFKIYDFQIINLKNV